MSCLSILDPSLAAEVGRDREGRSGCLVLDPSSSSCHSSSFSPSPAAVASSPTESSSIGKNTDDEEEEEEEEDDDGECEVKSPFKGSFNASMNALEETLPMRRGISRFYNGKSSSFTCLLDASSSSSIKSIIKPDNAYSRKRRNLLAHTLLSDNIKTTKTSHLIRISHIDGGISKKPTITASSSTSLSRLALAVATTTTTTGSDAGCYINLDGSKLNRDSRKGGSSPPLISPLRTYTNDGGDNGGGIGDGCLSPSSPLYWRSFSLADLQHSGGAGTNSNLGSPDHIS